jgi:hypothetical protein
MTRKHSRNKDEEVEVLREAEIRLAAMQDRTRLEYIYTHTHTDTFVRQVAFR